MRRSHLVLAVVLVCLALPAAARADGITANCTASGITSVCDSHWYTSDVTVSFLLPAGSSNPQGCGNVTITSDTTGQTITCTVSVSGSQCCRLDVTIKRDATPPTATAIDPQRAPDANGWYNHALGVAVSGTDATSGIASCASTTYTGPDSSSASVSGTCTDNAGNVSAPKTLTFEYDATAPSVSAAPARGPDANGWYNHPVDIAFQGSDSTSGNDTCTSATYGGPDNGSATVTGTCRDKAGNAASGTFALRYDATPPATPAAAADRPPDANGWYNHALTVSFSSSDATSGIASCDASSYDKPDDAAAAVVGRCRDNAGNISPAASFGFRFDSTPPKLDRLAVNAQDRSVSLTWAPSADVARLTVQRMRAGSTTPVGVYNGRRVTTFTDKGVRNGTRYTYVVTAFDEAGNEATAKVVATPSAALIAPRAAAHVSGATTLRWRAIPRATYYNVQLWVRGRKVLTTWPSATSFRLPRLGPGRYTWLVWPGLGPRAKHRYGPLVGRSTFVVG